MWQTAKIKRSTRFNGEYYYVLISSDAEPAEFNYYIRPDGEIRSNFTDYLGFYRTPKICYFNSTRNAVRTVKKYLKDVKLIQVYSQAYYDIIHKEFKLK